VQHFTEWKDGLKKVAELAKNKDNDGVIKEGLAIPISTPTMWKRAASTSFWRMPIWIRRIRRTPSMS